MDVEITTSRREILCKQELTEDSKMKKLAGFLLIIICCLFPIWGHADIIGNVNLQEYSSSPIGKVTFPGMQANWYNLDYDVKLNGGVLSEAFCVESSGGPGPLGTIYTLLSIDSGLSVFGLNAQKYLTAAWVAQNYFNGSDLQKASAQIAIWEIIFDYGSYNLGAGNFRSNPVQSNWDYRYPCKY